MHYLGMQDTHSQKVREETELVQDLIPVLRDEKKIIFKTSASQVERYAMRKWYMQHDKGKGTTDTREERLDAIQEKLEAEGFEDYTNMVGDYKKRLDEIEQRQRWMRNHPCGKYAADWIRKKRHGRDVSRLKRDKKREILDELCKKAKSGGDNRLLAQAAALARDNDVFFISNDGDHTTLAGYMRTVTRDRLWVMYPEKVRASLIKKGRNPDSWK